MNCTGIRIENATLARGGRPVFRDLNLTLTERRIGVVGRNGSGKSSLVRLIGGLEAPGRGRVTAEGADVARDRRAALAAVGMIFQNPDHQILFPTVEEEVAFGLEQQGRTRRAARAAARDALARHGRLDWAERSTHSLSQGQRRLLCLIAVMAMEPATLVLDEPFAGLDIPTSARLHRALDAVAQRVILVSHDPAALAGYDRVIWLEAGRIAADGPAPEVLPAFRAGMARLAARDDDGPDAGGRHAGADAAA